MGGKRAAENSGDGKRRKQGAYNSGSWGNTKTISPGQRGIIFTIDPYKEPQAIKEIKGLFSRYCAAASSPADDLALQADKCVSDLLHDSLKNAGSKLATLGDFLQTGCRGNLFYKLHPSTKATPNEIARSVVEGLQSSGKAETRFVYKMQPIFTTVAAHPEAIERDFVPKLNALASESVPAPLTKYAVVWTKKSCSNPAMDRTNISCSLARHLQTPNVMAAYKGPNTALIVSIYRSVACLGLIKGYDKYCEYNVHKLSRRAEADVPAARQEKLQVEPGDEGEEVEEVEEVEELDEAAEPPTALVNTAGNAQSAEPAPSSTQKLESAAWSSPHEVEEAEKLDKAPSGTQQLESAAESSPHGIEEVVKLDKAPEPPAPQGNIAGNAQSAEPAPSSTQKPESAAGSSPHEVARSESTNDVPAAAAPGSQSAIHGVAAVSMTFLDEADANGLQETRAPVSTNAPVNSPPTLQKPQCQAAILEVAGESTKCDASPKHGETCASAPPLSNPLCGDDAALQSQRDRLRRETEDLLRRKSEVEQSVLATLQSVRGVRQSLADIQARDGESDSLLLELRQKLDLLMGQHPFVSVAGPASR